MRRLNRRNITVKQSLTAVLMFVCFSSPLAAAPNQEKSGITLHGTRVIFPESATGGVSYDLTNNTDELFLLQARVSPYLVTTADDAADSTKVNAETDTDTTTQADVIKTPIVVLPPLQRFEPREKVTLRIRLADEDNALPTDRESVFALELKAIPGQFKPDAPTDSTEKADGVTLQFAVQNNLKLFYRPTGLPALTAQQVSEKLQFRLQGDTLTVNNPTAYYVTFSQITLGKAVLPETDLGPMVPPFSTQHYPVPKGAASAKLVRWQTLNDYAEATKEQQQAF